MKARLDCEKKDCVNYGGLGCHGTDDPLNQTCCWLKLNKAKRCLDSKPKYIHYDAKCTCGDYWCRECHNRQDMKTYA